MADVKWLSDIEAAVGKWLRWDQLPAGAYLVVWSRSDAHFELGWMPFDRGLIPAGARDGLFTIVPQRKESDRG